MEFLIKLSLRDYKSEKPITVLIRSVVVFRLVATAACMWPSIYIILVATLPLQQWKTFHSHDKREKDAAFPLRGQYHNPGKTFRSSIYFLAKYL